MAVARTYNDDMTAATPATVAAQHGDGVTTSRGGEGDH